MLNISQVMYVSTTAICTLSYWKLKKLVSGWNHHNDLPLEKYSQFDNLLVSLVNAIVTGIGACIALMRVL